MPLRQIYFSVLLKYEMLYCAGVRYLCAVIDAHLFAVWFIGVHTAYATVVE
jgi:hypothetical protein